MQDGYRAAFTDVHAFSQNRFGDSVDTSILHIIIKLEADVCGGGVSWGQGGAYITIRLNQVRCPNDFRVDYGLLAHEYFHVLQYKGGFPYFSEPTWVIEGSAEYFSYLYLAQEGIASYNGVRDWAIEWVSQNDPSPLSNSYTYDAAAYRLGFLAIDYLAGQTGETALIDYFTAESRSSVDSSFEETFQSVFGISPAIFYDYFAAHRAAGFPQPGAPIDSLISKSTPTPTSVPIAGDGRIAFSSNRNGNHEIYVMNANGTDVSQLTNGTGDNYHPSWSLDGRRIAFSSYKDGDYGIYVMNADGTGVSRLTSGVSPDWSPVGQQIAFSSGSEVYVMNADGTGVSYLTDGISPAWSPDGQQIAFSSHRDGNWNIYVINSDGSNLTRLTNHQDDDWDPAWSPDGRRIAFVARRHDINEIYVMTADGKQQTRLIRNHRYPAWSPDGQRIAIETFRTGNSEIWALNADGSNRTRLTNHPADDLDPAWTSASARQVPASPTPTHTPIATPTATPTHTPTATPVTGGDTQIRLTELERQMGVFQQLIQNLQSLIQALTNRVTALDGGTTPAVTPIPTATPTPSPTPTSVPGTDPTPVTDNACVEQIELDSLIAGTSIAGTWTTDCLTANPGSDPTIAFYAKFYTFTLDNREELEFIIDSDHRPYIYMMSGEGTDGETFYAGPIRSGEQMQLLLDPGSYTFEITTDQPNVTGDFELWMGLRPDLR